MGAVCISLWNGGEWAAGEAGEELDAASFSGDYCGGQYTGWCRFAISRCGRFGDTMVLVILMVNLVL